MGRGRAKAKQTKVARQLKYSSPDMDLNALQQELAGSGEHDDHAVDHDEPEGRDHGTSGTNPRG